MAEQDFILQVDHELTFNVNTQIKEQLKWLIGIGHIAVGDMLPSASQLAEELGLNRNTINWVYTQLREEGLVTMQKGRGTQVVEGHAVQQLRKERIPMQAILENVIQEAESEKIDLQQLFMASLAYSLLHNPRSSNRLRILFIECKGHDHLFYHQSIEEATHGEVETVFLEDWHQREQDIIDAIKRNYVIVTTLNHADEVKALLSTHSHKIIVIGATVDTSALLEIAQLQRGTAVAFACLGKTGGEWMASRVQEAGIQHLHYEIIGWNEQKQALNSYQHLDKIFASAAVYPEMKKLIPDKVELFPMRLEKSSDNLLHDISMPSNP
jgi:DNA-binding transcriptional regulator YhcF (GntR family)